MNNKKRNVQAVGVGLAQGMDMCRAVVSAAMNLQVLYCAGHVLHS